MHTFQRGDAVLTARTVQRQLAALLPESRPAGAGDSTLEIAGQGMDAPRLISATMLEGGPLCRRLVPGAPTPGFRAFLDGTQRSEVISYVAGKLDIEQLLAVRARQLGDAFTMEAFMDEFAAAGLIPASLLRWELTGEAPDVLTMLSRR